MSEQVYRYENPFRPVYEYYAVMAWFAVAALSVAFIFLTAFPRDFFILFAAMCCLFGGLRMVRATALARDQQALEGQKLSFITRKELIAKVTSRQKRKEPPAIFLGYGFTWTQEHTQLAHTIARADPTKVIPPHDDQMGQTWIHGIGMRQEEEIWLPIEHTAGHMLLAGTTRAGKSRTLDLIIAQAVARGEGIAIFDPKGDLGLKQSAQNACIDAGRPEDFLFFHNAFPQESVRIDPLANFSKATELATRIAVLIPSETGADPFMAHSQQVLTNICEGLLMINAKPTLKLFKRYVDSGVEGLIVKAAEAYFSKHIAEWRQQAEAFITRAKGRSDRELAIGYIEFYRQVVVNTHPSIGLEGLFADFEHEKSHQSKMLASLTPVLTLLCAGHIGDLLSPDPESKDMRTITDFARAMKDCKVLYLGLDSLSDSMVASAVGSIFLSDMTAMSGARYNYSDQDALKPVNVIVDEAGEMVGDKLTQMLNKAGGSRIRCILALQTLGDIEAKTGSEAKARQVLGNLNNTLALRLIDGPTMEYMAESLPETYVRHIEYTQATSTDTKDLVGFGFRMTEAMKETAVPMVPAPMFSCLPNLEFFAKLSAGRLVKCRIPILKG
jgi:conjugal transfer pilus assembly protein TraD